MRFCNQALLKAQRKRLHSLRLSPSKAKKIGTV